MNSYSHGYAWTDNQVKGIQQVFAQRDDVVLRIEYLDTKVINDWAYFQMLTDIYIRKYKNQHIDLIITTDDEALDFMRQYRDYLFPGVPLVFSGVNGYDRTKTAGIINFTGINEAPDFDENLELIKQLLPGTREIVLISDSLSSTQALRKKFEEDTKNTIADLGLTITDLPKLPLEEMEKRLAQLKPHQVIFYLSFFQDGAGIPYTPSEVLPIISSASAVPVFGTMDYMMGLGILGGILETAEEQGVQAALMAEKIMTGVPASSIPILMHGEHKHRLVFDYQQLQRFGLNEDQLPSGSKLVNEPETFYYLYKNIIWSAAIAFSILLAYIGALLINLRHRARTQKGLQSILETSQTLFDVQAKQQFKSKLRENLKKILPEARDIMLMRYKGPKDHFNESDLAILGTEHHAIVDDEAKHLIANAVTENRYVYDKQKAVAKLESNNSPVNLLYVHGRRKLDKTDQQLFELFAGNVSMSIDNAATYQLSASLQTAHRIQNAMLPTNFAPACADFQLDLHAFVEPATEVGGDLYDFFALDDDHICLLVGDVSGKGVPAAIFMAMAKTVLRAIADISLSPAEILTRANNQLSRDNAEMMFVTLFLVIYNRKTGQLKYADGGHNAPYLLSSNGEVNMIKAQGGTALGVMEDLPYFDGELHLSEGDAVLLYTDGVTEATDETDELYGETR
ncbi:MAG: ABC transporter substrate binding protein, partial [Thiolinea sp.]